MMYLTSRSVTVRQRDLDGDRDAGVDQETSTGPDRRRSTRDPRPERPGVGRFGLQQHRAARPQGGRQRPAAAGPDGGVDTGTEHEGLSGTGHPQVGDHQLVERPAERAELRREAVHQQGDRSRST